MKTVIKHIKSGKTKKFVTQQYEVGLYVIEDDNPQLQYGLNIEEEEFHEKIRKMARENKNYEVIE